LNADRNTAFCNLGSLGIHGHLILDHKRRELPKF
jgi:hypothetical protein